MQPLQCAECKAQVLVQKNSWEHTTVQWSDQARASASKSPTTVNSGSERDDPVPLASSAAP